MLRVRFWSCFSLFMGGWWCCMSGIVGGVLFLRIIGCERILNLVCFFKNLIGIENGYSWFCSIFYMLFFIKIEFFCFELWLLRRRRNWGWWKLVLFFCMLFILLFVGLGCWRMVMSSFGSFCSMLWRELFVWSLLMILGWMK